MSLLRGLVDDAGLFPPAWLPMDEALVRFRASTSPMLSGRFLCPADRVDELVAVLDGPIDVHLIGATSVTLPSDPRITVRAVELRAGIHDGLPCYLEGIEPARLKEHGVFGKLRCGGAHIPSVEDVAAFVTASARHSVPFKATAGMHAAVRGWESTNGIPHHGYLNLLVAVSRAISGGNVAQALEVTDGDALAEEAMRLSDDQVLAVRWLFHSYGSCDTARPVEDAMKLGLL
ncbi:MAG: hypothetical protein JWM40_702 [Frankiales bacterium]|nr:hypothetical protein [Frankiales bacterium]